jgi:anti-anti-sigma regulatory factor
MIEILCRSEPGAMVLEILGDLDTSTRTVLDWCLDAALETHETKVVIDLRQAAPVDGAVSRELDAAADRLARRGVHLLVRNGGARGGELRPSSPPRFSRTDMELYP